MSEEIKIGTKIVAGMGGWNNNGFYIHEIVRETPKQWVSSEGKRYRKDDLRLIGGYGRLTVCTEDHIRLNKIYSLKKKIGNLLYDIDKERNRIEIEDANVLGRVYRKLVEVKEVLMFKEQK